MHAIFCWVQGRSSAPGRACNSAWRLLVSLVSRHSDGASYTTSSVSLDIVRVCIELEVQLLDLRNRPPVVIVAGEDDLSVNST